MILFLIGSIITTFLWAISICLRITASGIKTANRALDGYRDELEQESTSRDVMNYSYYMLRKLSKFFKWLALSSGLVSTIGGVIIGLVIMVVLISGIMVAIDLQGSLDDAISNNQDNGSDKCEEGGAGGYWEELEVCFDADATHKVYTNMNMVTAPDSEQYKMIHSEDFYVDDAGFGRLKDKELGIDFYAIAWSATYNGGIGEKYRMTLRNDKGDEHYVYVVMVDLRQCQHSRPDSNGKTKYCYPQGSNACAEFYIDYDKMKASNAEGFNAVQQSGDVSSWPATDTEHDLKGGCVKIEHYLGIDGNGTSNPDLTISTDAGKIHPEAKVVKEKYKDGDSNSCKKEKNTVAINGRVLWVGDSRTVGLEQACSGSGQWDNEKDITNASMSKVGAGYSYYIQTSIPEVKKLAKSDDTIVVNYGVNDLGGGEDYVRSMARKYATMTNELAKVVNGAKVIYMSVNPVDDSRSQYVKMDSVKIFNEEIQKHLSGVTYVDTCSGLLKSDFLTSEYDGEGLHYGPKTYGYIYDSIRNGNGKTVVNNGVEINFNTRYYAKGDDGIYGTAKGISKLPESISMPFKINSDGYAMGRAWQVNNPNGICPLPSNYSGYLAEGKKPKWATGEEASGLFSKRADIPIEHGIISYTTGNGSGIVREAFIEYVDSSNGYVEISWVSGETEKYAGHKVRVYSGVDQFLKEQKGELNSIFQPIGDGHK